MAYRNETIASLPGSLPNLCWTIRLSDYHRHWQKSGGSHLVAAIGFLVGGPAIVPVGFSSAELAELRWMMTLEKWKGSFHSFHLWKFTSRNHCCNQWQAFGGWWCPCRWSLVANAPGTDSGRFKACSNSWRHHGQHLSNINGYIVVHRCKYNAYRTNYIHGYKWHLIAESFRHISQLRSTAIPGLPWHNFGVVDGLGVIDLQEISSAGPPDHNCHCPNPRKWVAP